MNTLQDNLYKWSRCSLTNYGNTCLYWSSVYISRYIPFNKLSFSCVMNLSSLHSRAPLYKFVVFECSCDSTKRCTEKADLRNELSLRSNDSILLLEICIETFELRNFTIINRYTFIWSSLNYKYMKKFG